MKGQIAGYEDDTYICVLGNENSTVEELNKLQKAVTQVIGENHITESENRIQEQEANDKQIQGMITIPLTIVFVGFMLHASYLEVGTFLAEAPFVPIAVFLLGIWGTVALAYYLGWRSIRKINLAEILRDDTMM